MLAMLRTNRDLRTLFVARQSSAVQGAARVRGNVPGEWRYWGADAWSTRYSPLDQINAANFGSLEVAWQWNASSLGPDEYYRTTPLYANGRLFTVASTRRVAACIPPERLEWTRREGAFTAGRPSRYPGLGVPTPPLFGLTAEEVRARSSGT